MKFAAWFLIVGLVGLALGQARGRTWAGLWWGLFLGPLGWAIVLLGPNPLKKRQELVRQAHDRRMEQMQAAQISELRALRSSLASPPPVIELIDDRFWVRLNDREIGPLGKPDLMELYALGKLPIDTPVARDVESNRVYRRLSEELPALQQIVIRDERSV